MRKTRFRLIQIIAMIVILGLALFSPLLGLQAQKAAGPDMNIPPQPARVAAFDRPRPEVRIERVLKLDELTGFDPDIASLLNSLNEQQPVDHAPAGESAQPVEQLASLSKDPRGGEAR